MDFFLIIIFMFMIFVCILEYARNVESEGSITVLITERKKACSILKKNNKCESLQAEGERRDRVGIARR